MKEKKVRYYLNFQAYGVRISIGSANIVYLEEIENRLIKIIPNGFELIEKSNIEHNFLIKKRKNGDYKLFRNEKNVANSSSEKEFYDFIESEIRLTIAEFAVSNVFIHAGVVAWKNKAIIIPGSSFTGKTSLIAELIKKGALYYSDEYAVLGENGFVHPFPKMLSLRGIIDDFQQVDYSANSLGAETGVDPIPVGLILFTEYDSSLEYSQNDLDGFPVDIMSKGQALLEIIQHTIPIRNKPAPVLQVLKKMVNCAIAAKCKRGEVKIFADLLLEFFEKSAT